MVNHSPALAFKAETLSGHTISVPGGYQGKLVLVDFWATWCAPCRAQIPYLRQAHERFHGQGLEIVGVSLDSGAAESVQRFAADQKMSWEQVQKDSGPIAGAYGVTAIPAASLIDGDTGALLAAGDDLHGDVLLKTIASHLKQPRP